MSEPSKDSRFVPELESPVSLSVGSLAGRKAEIEMDDHILGHLLDGINHSFKEDATGKQCPTLEATKSSLRRPSNTNGITVPIQSGQVDLQVMSSKMADFPRDDSILCSTRYCEWVLASEQCNRADSSKLKMSSPNTVRSKTVTNAGGRLRNGFQNGRSINNTSEGEERQPRLPQTRQFFQKGGKAPKKASVGRYRSISRMPAAATRVEWNGGPGMRAVFLKSQSSRRREFGGTGVFLPPSNGEATSDFHQRKPTCSMVLLPLRIIQALNLNVDNMAPRPLGTCTTSRSKASPTRVQQQTPQQMYMMKLTPPATISNSQSRGATSRSLSQPRQDQQSNALLLELGLPTEWTY